MLFGGEKAVVALEDVEVISVVVVEEEFVGIGRRVLAIRHS